MNRQQKQNEKGFTIIEVVLVLAIAALIFLMVFIALPALQRSQRDSQIKSDLARAQTALNQYQSNNRNKLPGTSSSAWNSFKTSYLKADGDTFEDPSRGEYVFSVRSRTTTPTFDQDSAVINVNLSSTCDGEKAVAAGSRSVALRMKLEGGGVACVNN